MAGYSVQLSHDATEKGTFRDAHGAVTLSTSDGIELAHDEEFQHNRNYRQRTERTETLVSYALDKLKDVPRRATHAADVPAIVKIPSKEEGATNEDCVETARSKAAEAAATTKLGSTAAATA